MASNLRELIPDAFVEPREANTWRVEPFDNGFVIDFGTWESSQTVRVHARIRIPDDGIEAFVASVVSMAIEYCEHIGIELSCIRLLNDGDGEPLEPQAEAENK